MVERPAATHLLRLDPPTAPAWVGEAIGPSARPGTEVEKDGVLVQTRGSEELLLVRTTLPRASSLSEAAFRKGVARCYVESAEVLAARERCSIRIWNYIPSIGLPSESGFSRYEVFNEGRGQGYRECYGDSPTDTLVTASAVGHRGDDLVIHTLAASQPATPFENPRQRPAYRYSARYGPEPPTFCRASCHFGPSVGAHSSGGVGQNLGMVSGTASITGEDSRHAGDLNAQIAETFLNLAAIGAELAQQPPPRLADEGRAASLACYRELRVYVVREADAEAVARAVTEAFPNLDRFDLAAADLCRPELLVEAEGIVRLEA